MSQASPSVARGVALLDLGRAKEAEQSFRDALAADPSDDQALAYLAHALLEQDRFVDARSAARNALAADPHNLTALTALASAHAGVEEWKEALETIDNALALAPEFGGLHRQAGAILSMQKRHPEAIAALQQAVRLDPESSSTWSTLARALHAARRQPEAEAALERALQLDPQSADAHQVRSVFLLKQGGGARAVSTSRESLRLDPTSEANREIYALARKSRNPLYGLLLRFSFFLESKPPGVRLALLLLPFFASRLLRPYDDALWARVLIGALIAIVVLTWVLEPLMNTLLLTTRAGRGLLSPLTKRATYAFLIYAAAALGFGVATAVDAAAGFGLLALGLALWAVTAGHIHGVDAHRLRTNLGLHAGGAALSVAAVGTALTGAGAADGFAALLVLSGVAMTWLSALT
ncbi:tetratricopeptide repeat protein [Nocardioides sp.]|uniref:tetratricopeptide repeat protein n=1 Tax=Nocardioides sp. TaxID=35761 RepID=UPI002C842A7B|nr:tetratricopeptide repeat protein [Nocardioides sp.]HXH78920.1 tetratricopeptide repeat protein [Nocardioides sp.]